ncbi:MAG: SpaA isopeptide-forming pilin-related protein [Hornefia sp.]|nr:SpaA isopeptide-forming pilin-related protein [Hornefia sp.]
MSNVFKKIHKCFSAWKISIIISLLLIICSSGISVMEIFALGSLGVGNPTNVTTPAVVSNQDVAPSNYISIVDGIPGSKVSLIEKSSSVHRDKRLDNPVAREAMWYGDYEKSLKENQIFSAMHGGNKGGYTIVFKPSNPKVANHETDPKSGWDAKDWSLATTTMQVKVRYTNAAYYNGELVDAVATIRVTPMKNRTTVGDGSQFHGSYGQKNYTKNPYYPIIQVSDVLYRGWVWQNVKEFKVDLQFYKKGQTTAIKFPNKQFGDPNAAYYTINSLNPPHDTYWELATPNDYQEKHWQGAPAAQAYGAEYVVPAAGTVSNVYKTANSNIVTSYNGGAKAGVQYGYNGGSNHNSWNYIQDNPKHPDWSKNSVMFTTANTDRVSVTMGNMERDPITTGGNVLTVPKTDFMWATISTQAFTNNKINYKDIHVNKKWHDEFNHDSDDIQVDLYYEYYNRGKRVEVKAQGDPIVDRNSIVLKKSTNWEGHFYQVPDEDSLSRLLVKKLKVQHGDITKVKYFIRETKKPKTYDPKITGDSKNGFIVTNVPNLRLKVEKLDGKNEKKLLEGAEFSLYLNKNGGGLVKAYDNETDFKASNQKWKTVFKTDKNGALTIYGLRPGRYYLKETKAPNGYSLNTKMISVDIDEKGNVTGEKDNIVSFVQNTVNVKDSLLIFKLKKVDSKDQKKVLKGAEFSIYSDAACKKIVKGYEREADFYAGDIKKQKEVFITGTDGQFAVYGLNPGTYYLKERKAPEGYELNNTVVKVVINPEGSYSGTNNSYVTFAQNLVTVKDNRLYTLPNSGGSGTYIFMVIGSALVALAVMLFVNRKKLTV